MKKTLSILLVVVLIVALVVPAFAANVSYSFYLKKNGQNFTYNPNGNIKLYVGEVATIKCTTDALGYGYKLQLAKYSASGYKQATSAYWYSGTNYTLHPPYLTGMAEANTYYYIGGRIDDACSGPYTASGVFNSDYTTP